MRHHPEEKANEIYLGNYSGDTVPDYLLHIKSCRLGSQPYDREGKKIDLTSYHKVLRPMFEAVGNDYNEYDRVMVARFNKIKRGY